MSVLNRPLFAQAAPPRSQYMGDYIQIPPQEYMSQQIMPPAQGIGSIQVPQQAPMMEDLPPQPARMTPAEMAMEEELQPQPARMTPAEMAEYDSLVNSGILSTLPEEPEEEATQAGLGGGKSADEGIPSLDTLAAELKGKEGAEDVSTGEIKEALTKESEKYSKMFGGDPSAFLLDFGLALMASKSSNFFTALGEAGLVARKSAKERRKLDIEEDLSKLKKKKLEAEVKKLGRTDYTDFISKLDVEELTPESQRKVLAAMSHGKSMDEIYGLVNYAEDSSSKKKPTISNISFTNDKGKRVTRAAKEEDGKVFVRDPSAEGGWTEITDPYIKVQAKAEIGAATLSLGAKPAQKEHGELLTRRANVLTFIAGQRQAQNLFKAAQESGPLIRDVIVSGQAIREALPKLANVVTGFVKGTSVDGRQKKLTSQFDEFFEENPVSDEMASWAGSAEAFKAVMFTQAIKYGAAQGHTGKSMSDTDLKGWLSAVGANARTKQGFWTITTGLEEDLISSYNQTERAFIRKLSDEDKAAFSPVDWEAERKSVGADFGGVFLDHGLGDPRRWKDKIEPTTSFGTIPEDQEGRQNMLIDILRSRGRDSATKFIKQIEPNASQSQIDSILKQLEDLLVNKGAK